MTTIDIIFTFLLLLRAEYHGLLSSGANKSSSYFITL